MNQNWTRYSPWISLTLGVSTIALSACSKTLDTAKLENDIQQTIIKQGGVSLKAVDCPRDVALAAGKGFDCVGTLESGSLLAIPVTQTDDQGTTKWEVPNSRGLLNLSALASLFQQTIRQEGRVLTVDCGTGYRSVQPGDRFECKIAKGSEKAGKSQKSAEKTGKKVLDSKQPESIVVTIDPQNNVNWRQILPAVEVEVASAKLQASTPQPTPTIAAQDRAKLSPDIVQKLDQMGGGDSE